MRDDAIDRRQQRREARLRRLLTEIAANNPFYRRKLAQPAAHAFDRFTLGDLARLPTTGKDELIADQAASPPFGTDLTYPLERYVRLHQTSGTTGRPLRWLDTVESWTWWLDCWGAVYARAGVTAADRVFVAFSFGPFIGFWTAFEAAQRLGALAISGGAQTSEERLANLRESGATVLVSTPTYALRLAEVGAALGLSTRDLGVRLTIHAGEPGASVPNVKRRIEEAWGARVVDHAGATEVGAWGVRPVSGILTTKVNKLPTNGAVFRVCYELATLNRTHIESFDGKTVLTLIKRCHKFFCPGLADLKKRERKRKK